MMLGFFLRLSRQTVHLLHSQSLSQAFMRSFSLPSLGFFLCFVFHGKDYINLEIPIQRLILCEGFEFDWFFPFDLGCVVWGRMCVCVFLNFLK